VKVGDYVKIKLEPTATGIVVPSPAAREARGAINPIWIFITNCSESQYVGKTYHFRRGVLEVLSENR
jgi:hypothetical protein